MEHEYYMREALREAQKAMSHNDVPVGAIIVADGKIIAKAHNQVELLADPTAHAEMLAITQASTFFKDKNIKESTLYVTLEPCSMCAGALVLARIKTIFYATSDPKTGACGSLFDIVGDIRLNHQIKVIHGLMKGEAENLIKIFFSKLRKEKK